MRNPIKWDDPVGLATAVLLGTVMGMFITHWTSNNGTLPWRAVAVAMLFFAIANQVSGLLVKNWGRYLLISFGCFAALMTILLFIAKWLSDIPLTDLFYMRRIYVLLVLFNILMILLAGTFRVLHGMLKD